MFVVPVRGAGAGTSFVTGDKELTVNITFSMVEAVFAALKARGEISLLGAKGLLSSRGEHIVAHNVLVSAGTMLAGVLGFAFQVVISHRVQPSEYGAIFAVMTLLTLVGLPAGALQLMMAREASRDRANGQHASSAAMLHDGNRILLLGGVVIAAIALVASPLLSRFFSVPVDLLVAGSVGLPFVLALPLLIGDLQGEQRFLAFSSMAFGQAAFKLVAAVLLGFAFGAVGIVLGVSFGSGLSYAAAHGLLRRKLSIKARWPWQHQAMAYLGILLPSTLALAVLLSSDLLLVKHFFAPGPAGEYAAVVALSRALYYAAAGVAIVLFPKVIFRESQGTSGSPVVWLSVALVVTGGVVGLVVLTVGSSFFLSAFAGKAYIGGATYLPWYAAGMILLGAAAVLIATHQTGGRRQFLAVLIPVAALEPIAILFFHGSLIQVVRVVDICMLALVVGLAVLYLAQRSGARTIVFGPKPELAVGTGHAEAIS
jgi:O-antigen/teichoic acid export membrane protein